MKTNTSIVKAPNGEWLVLTNDNPDKLIAVRKSRFAARIAKRQHDAGRTVFVTLPQAA